MAEPLQSCLHQLLALSLFSSTKHSPTPDSHLPWAHLWLPWHHKEHSSFLLLLDPSATFDIVYSSSVWSSFSLGFPLALFYSQIILFFYIFHLCLPLCLFLYVFFLAFLFYSLLIWWLSLVLCLDLLFLFFLFIPIADFWFSVTMRF